MARVVEKGKRSRPLKARGSRPTARPERKPDRKAAKKPAPAPALVAKKPPVPVMVSMAVSRPVKALVFELETLGLAHGRKTVYESAKSTLSGAGVALSPMFFSKAGIEITPSAFITEAFNALKVRLQSQPKLKLSFDECLRKTLCAKPALKPGLAETIAKANAHGVKSVAMSLLDPAAAGDLMQATGLAGMGVDLVCGHAWIVHPYQDNLVNQVLSRLRLHPGTCLTLVSSGAAAEAALCAGTKVLAFPDSFTSFQGFSGVDEVLDMWSPEVVQSVLSLNGEGHG